MKKHFLLVLLFGLNIQIVLSQTPSKIENMQLFTDVNYIAINDTVTIDKYDVSGVVLLNDTSEIKTLAVVIYTVNPSTSAETILNDASTNFNILHVKDDNSVPGFFVEDNKVFFTIKNIISIHDRYVRFKVLSANSTVLDSISILITNN